MYEVPLTALPNQSIAFNVDGAYWQVRVFQSINFMCADITRNGQAVITGVRCFGGIPLMPYPYMYEPNFGNFVFDSDADWTNFDSSCHLYYLTNAEFAEFQTNLEVGFTLSQT
jgi:hypothetical protein